MGEEERVKGNYCKSNKNEEENVFQKKFNDVYGLIFLTDVFRPNSALILKAQEF